MTPEAQLFVPLVLTLFMVVAGVREIHHRNYAMGAILIGIPFCGWLSILIEAKWR